MTEILVVFVTVGNEEEAIMIGRTLVEEKLVACVNMVPQIRSIYWWKGEVCDHQELLLMMKTPISMFDSLQSRIRELHSYELPEIVALSVAKGLPDYLEWVTESTSQQ